MGSSTDLAHILFAMGVITEEQLSLVEEKEEIARDHLTADTLLDGNFCTYEQLRVARNIQVGLRSKSPADNLAASCALAKQAKSFRNGVINQLIETGEFLAHRLRPVQHVGKTT